LSRRVNCCPFQPRVGHAATVHPRPLYCWIFPKPTEE
jgi:hypothetical protein